MGESKMTHRVLILGSQGEFVQLVQMAKERGYEVLVCDGYADGPARAYADASYVIPVTDIQAVAELCIREKVDGILTSFSDLLLECMVKIADQAGLPCYLKPEQLPWYRDKSVCRETLKKLGLPTPGFMKLPVELIEKKKESELKRLTADLCYPLISKPMDKYGSRGIFVIHHEGELLEKVGETAEFTELPEILVEEYNDGFEFNMMTWVLEGQVHLISIADREKTEFVQGMLPESTRNVYPSCLLSQVEKEALEILQGYISYTGQKEGALSMQFFWKPDRGIQVCEIAARFFGYEHELTEMVYGFSLEELLLNSLYDREALEGMIQKHDPHRPRRFGAVLYFHGRFLTVKDQSAAEKLALHPAVAKPWIFYQTGEPVVAYGPNPYMALYYIQADTREELDRITGEFYREMSIRDQDGQEIVYKNILPMDRNMYLDSGNKR